MMAIGSETMQRVVQQLFTPSKFPSSAVIKMLTSKKREPTADEEELIELMRTPDTAVTALITAEFLDKVNKIYLETLHHCGAALFSLEGIYQQHMEEYSKRIISWVGTGLNKTTGTTEEILAKESIATKVQFILAFQRNELLPLPILTKQVFQDMHLMYASVSEALCEVSNMAGNQPNF